MLVAQAMQHRTSFPSAAGPAVVRETNCLAVLVLVQGAVIAFGRRFPVAILVVLVVASTVALSAAFALVLSCCFTWRRG